MKKFRADLHVHTVLSPCAEVEMIPPLIVRTALERSIDLIAITDHNASANVAAVQKAAAGTGLTVLPGMEVQSREDVHLLTLFETLDVLEAWQTQVNESLPDLPNRPNFFGEQFVVDETGEFIRKEPRLLSTATHLSIDEIFERVHSLGGIVIPAHVERTIFGLFPTLGLISEKWQVLKLVNGTPLNPEVDLNVKIRGAYGADLMSDVLAFSQPKAVLLTGLTNPQVVRTAQIAEFRAIIFVRGKQPQPETLEIATQEKMPLVTSPYGMFELCGRLHKAGLPSFESNEASS